MGSGLNFPSLSRDSYSSFGKIGSKVILIECFQRNCSFRSRYPLALKSPIKPVAQNAIPNWGDVAIEKARLHERSVGDDFAHHYCHIRGSCPFACVVGRVVLDFLQGVVEAC